MVNDSEELLFIVLIEQFTCTLISNNSSSGSRKGRRQPVQDESDDSE